MTFRRQVWAICRQERIRAIAGPVYMVIQVFPPDARRRDLDNILKPLLDALQHGGAYGDDSQIGHLEIVRYHKRKGGEVWVTLKAI